MENVKITVSAGVISLLISSFSMAETTNCTGITLVNVAVQVPRDDNHFFQNRLTIKLAQECAGKSRIHAKLDHPAFNGFLSLALTAKSSGKPVDIAVNTNQATSISNQIAYISLSAD